MGRSLAKKGGSAKKKGGHADWMDDEIDDANRLRSKDKIGFDASDSEEEDPDADLDTEAVMDIGGDSDDDSDADSDEEEEDAEEEEEEDDDDDDEGDDDDDDDDDLGSDDDEDEAALIRAMKAQQKKLASKGVKRGGQDDSSSDEEEEEEDDGLRIKGRKKADFYGDEEVDHEGMSDEDERRDEEREARRLQQARAAGMSAADFGLSDDEDDSEDDESDSEPEEEATLGAKAAKLSAKGKKAEKESLKKVKKNVASLGAAVESLGGEELEAAEGADAETGDSPEVVALTKELTKNLDEVRNTIEPLCKFVREGNMVTKEGISYLDTKHLLMLSYCINIAFYLLLKAEGRPVKDHPVVLRLVEIRTYIEKLRPIDKKLKYQIDKLLKMAKEGVTGEEEDADGAGEDPLQFRPNPDALVSKVDEDAEEGADGGVYRPPKMMPTAMEEFEEGGKSSKQKRAEKEARRRAQRSSLIKELAQELGEAPEELGGDEGDMQSAFAKREFARMEARAKIEEDLFTRVPLSKVERRRQKATTRSVNSLSQVGDFGDDVADLVEVAEELENKKRTRLVDSVTQLGAKPKKAKATSGDADLPMRDSLGDRRDKYERGVNRKMAAKAREEEEAADREAARERRRVDEDEEYAGAATLRDRKRAAKEEKYRRQAGIIAPLEEEIGDFDKRHVGKKIMENRGLTPHRSKDHKNPRKRLRDKFAKAQIRRKGQVRSMREDGGGYAGEATGIKTSVSKSRRFGK